MSETTRRTLGTEAAVIAVLGWGRLVSAWVDAVAGRELDASARRS